MTKLCECGCGDPAPPGRWPSDVHRFIKGHHRRGVKASSETRTKMSASARVPKPHKRGPLNHNWKGGITPANRQARASLAQVEWSIAVKERDDYTCQKCGERGGNLHAHHIKSFSEFPELRTVLANGLTFCKACHKEVHA